MFAALKSSRHLAELSAHRVPALFVNMWAMYFIPYAVRAKNQWPDYAVCFVSAIIMLLQLYPFEWAGSCPLGEVMCAERMCSVSGDWHIAWEVPTNGMLNFITVESWASFLTAYPGYFVDAFLMPLLYGSWRLTVYHFLIGPRLAMLPTSDPNEVAAIWCLLSIGFLLLVVKTPLRQFMFVKSWWLWPRQWLQMRSDV